MNGNHGGGWPSSFPFVETSSGCSCQLPRRRQAIAWGQRKRRRSFWPSPGRGSIAGVRFFKIGSTPRRCDTPLIVRKRLYYEVQNNRHARFSGHDASNPRPQDGQCRSERCNGKHRARPAERGDDRDRLVLRRRRRHLKIDPALLFMTIIVAAAGRSSRPSRRRAASAFPCCNGSASPASPNRLPRAVLPAFRTCFAGCARLEKTPSTAPMR
jgi:hypothetical protein